MKRFLANAFDVIIHKIQGFQFNQSLEGVIWNSGNHVFRKIQNFQFLKTLQNLQVYLPDGVFAQNQFSDLSGYVFGDVG